MDSTDKDMKYDEMITYISKGNLEYLNNLYSELNKDVFLLSLSIVKNYHLAEDILQDTFLLIQTKATSYQAGSNPKAWIMSIARNRAYDLLRMRRNNLSIDEIADVSCDETMDDKVESTIDLTSALSTLTEEEQQIIILHDISGFKHKEIAEMLNLKPDSIRKKYTRIVKKLYTYYKGRE